MELHGSRPESRRQEIRCTDCGHVYLIAQGQLSSRCTHCGNIAAHTGQSASVLEPEFLKQASEPATPVSAFAALPDGNKVQEVLSAYQVEWQLWAKLVQNFSDPVYHAAYLSQAIAKNTIAQASERYREHGVVMTLSNEERWQSEISDLMLARLEKLSLLRMTQTESGDALFLKWVAMMNDQPLRARIVKFTWIVFGMMVALRLLLPLFKY